MEQCKKKCSLPKEIKLIKDRKLDFFGNIGFIFTRGVQAEQIDSLKILKTIVTFNM